MAVRRLATIASAFLTLVFLAPTAHVSLLQAAPDAVRQLISVCGPVPLGVARCDSVVVGDGHDRPLATSGPSGYGPNDLRSAYALGAASAGSGHTVAIVDAYDDPKAESDLAVYRTQFGLPACTTANGCFKKVNQAGVQGSYPSGNTGWGQEISLDLDMASAICPNCHILLVEATSPTTANLAVAEDTAARLGATEISNSYGGSESSTETTDEAHYNHAGIAITVSSGDSGYGVQFPAASRYVTAVGGTTLKTDSSARGWSETVWSGAGSGCSAYEPKQAWQTDSGCARRTVADVSAVADPATGVAVYDTYTSLFGSSGWLVFGGTSVAAPIIAGVYALGGHTVPYPVNLAYATPAALNDVVSGTNAKTGGGLFGIGGNKGCGGTYLCTGKPGYDGPTGLGTPKGTGSAF